jgi:NAD(P)-dependent dehydrogenase (short-subunit alcohol dehydrogenase family)
MLGEASPASRERYATNPMGRIGQPADIAHAVEYFASDEAGFVTGWILSVNGGMYT